MKFETYGVAVYVASIKHPKGNIAQALVSNGLAKVSDYSVASVTGGPLQLREAERKAQAARLRLWKNFVAPQQQKGSSFNGTVTKIISGDTIVVERDSDGQELKVTLSSIRQPRVKEEGFYQMEAKEYLRSKLIGKKVSVNLEYKKAATGDFEERSCGSVFLGSMNVAEALLNKGLAYVIFHKKDDLERSKYYDLYLVAHDKAQKENKGVHSGKEVAPLRIVDASENATKARSFLPSLKRAGKVSAVVEHVMSGNRFKLLVKKDSTKLSFLLGDVRTPRLGKPGSSQKSEPFAEEALRFVQRIVYQRDVEVEIENIDKSGVFIGSLFINGTNLALLLVQDGLAFVSNNVSRDYAKQLTDAENNAQSKDIKIWKLRNQELRKQEELEAKALPESNAFEIVVSEISAGDTFFYQEVAQGNKLVELMDNLNCSELKALFNPLKIGDLVAAQFSEDKAWYRAKVRKVLEGGSKYEVFYIDYGNSEVLPKSSLRVLDTVFAAVPGQAKEGKLAFVKSPPVTEEYGAEAAQMLSRLLSSSPTIKAKGIIRDGAVSYLLLLDPSSEASKQNLSMEKALPSSYNKEMLRLGYAQMGVIGKRFPEVQKILTPFFEEAKSERRGMYEYGDYSLDEDPAL
jgi:staphylococcal nuclease domain-containing protein 1